MDVDPKHVDPVGVHIYVCGSCGCPLWTLYHMDVHPSEVAQMVVDVLGVNATNVDRMVVDLVDDGCRPYGCEPHVCGPYCC